MGVEQSTRGLFVRRIVIDGRIMIDATLCDRPRTCGTLDLPLVEPVPDTRWEMRPRAV